MWLHSAVADYRLTGSEEAKVRGLNAASVLAGRYNPNGKFIRAWNPECVEEGEDCTGWIIVDSMTDPVTRRKFQSSLVRPECVPVLRYPD